MVMLLSESALIADPYTPDPLIDVEPLELLPEPLLPEPPLPEPSELPEGLALELLLCVEVFDPGCGTATPQPENAKLRLAAIASKLLKGMEV